MSSNKSALLKAINASLEVEDTSIPSPGETDIIVRNYAVAVNTIDPAQQAGFKIAKYPTVLGHDLAGEVYAVGSKVDRFKTGDRVIGHSWQFFTCEPEDGAFSLYCRIPAANTAILPDKIDYKDGVVLPLAIDTAAGGLFREGMMSLAWPDLDSKPNSNGQVVVVYGGSTSVGLAAIQLALNAGYRVVATASPRNFDVVKQAGASDVFDYRSPTVADDIAAAVGNDKFVGLYNAIGVPESFDVVKPIMEKLGGGFVANTKPPGELPSSINAKFVLGVGDHGFRLWEHWITKALETGKLQCLPPPKVVGTGLESLNDAFKIRDGDVSVCKIVVEL